MGVHLRDTLPPEQTAFIHALRNETKHWQNNRKRIPDEFKDCGKTRKCLWICLDPYSRCTCKEIFSGFVLERATKDWHWDAIRRMAMTMFTKEAFVKMCADLHLDIPFPLDMCQDDMTPTHCLVCILSVSSETCRRFGWKSFVCSVFTTNEDMHRIQIWK